MPPDQENDRKSPVRRKRRSQTDGTLKAFRRDTGGSQLRGNTARPPLSIREIAITFFLSLALVIPPWLKGSMSPLAHWITLAMALLAFLTLWVPMGRSNILNLNAPPSLARKTLARFPLFWLGLALLGYVLTAALNPRVDVDVVRTIQLWNEVDFIPWLPAGIKAPFPLASSWKVILEWGTVWLAACALWAGCRRRRTVHFLFWVVALNAAFVGLVGASHSFSGNRFYLWFGARITDYGVFGPFLYDNHAASYLVLGLGFAATLTLIHMGRAMFTRNGSHIFLGAVTLVILATLFVTRSRAGVLLGVACFGLLLILAARAFQKQGGGLGIGGVVALLVFGIGTLGLFSMVPWKRLGKDFSEGKKDTLISLDLGKRKEAYHATFDMWKDAPVLGWGSGSFRYAFPEYQDRSPILSELQQGKRFHWQHAHSDWLEELAELGILGFSLVAAGLLWIVSRLWFWRKYMTAASLMALGAGTLVLVHAGVDFVLQNPAVLLTLAVLILGSLRLALNERELGA